MAVTELGAGDEGGKTLAALEGVDTSLLV